MNALWDFRATLDSRSHGVYITEDEPEVRINELTRKGVIFLGILDESGAFAPYGTGFVVGWNAGDFDFLYLVTAKHVLEDMQSAKRPLAARLNTVGGKGEIGELSADGWEFSETHPKCDVAVSALSVSLTHFDLKYVLLPRDVLTKEYISKYDIGCGDPVFTVGLLINHFGTTKNLPIVRMGNIAAMPEEKADLGERFGRQEVYLIESRSLGGLSGSPVYLHTQLHRAVKGKIKLMGDHNTEYMMGVNVGLFETKAHGDKIPEDTEERRSAFLESISAGIAVVVPIERVIEIVETRKSFIERREEFLAQSSKRTGFVPTSAHIKPSGDDASALPATDENPTHRADFNRLLSAAARKPKQDR